MPVDAEESQSPFELLLAPSQPPRQSAILNLEPIIILQQSAHSSVLDRDVLIHPQQWLRDQNGEQDGEKQNNQNLLILAFSGEEVLILSL